jgi:phage-related baseplate assembly protein
VSDTITVPTNQVASLASLPTPQYVNDSDGLNPLLILNDMITSYETTASKTLYPAQVERLLINLYAYREVLVRNAIQNTGLQNLLAFAVFPALDYIGQNVGVARLDSQSATTTEQFTLNTALTVSFTLPAGSQVGSNDGLNIFQTTAPLVFSPGQTVGSVTVSAVTAGPGANGYIPGQISVLIGASSLVASATNTTTSGGGDDPESDAHLRVRIQAAPNQFSSAGPTGAYRFFTLSASSQIIDAAISTPVPGTVAVAVLTGPITAQPAPSPNPQGIASSGILSAVVAILNSTQVRPLTDTVQVTAVTEIDYTITANVTYYNNANLAILQPAAEENAEQLALNIANGLTQDLVPSQWVGALRVAGVYDVEVTIAANNGGTALTPDEFGRFVFSSDPSFWCNCTALDITFTQSDEDMPIA